MATDTQPFAFRFACPAPPQRCRTWASLPSLKGLSSAPQAWAGIQPFEDTMPQTTQFGQVQDLGHPDWDQD